MSKSSRLEASNNHESGLLAPVIITRWPKVTRFGQECFIRVVTTGTMHFVLKIWISGSQKCFICSCNGLLGAPTGAERSKNGSVVPVDPVNMGQLDHNVVFGTKSGAVQDFQRGKKCSIGVKQTPLDQC